MSLRLFLAVSCIAVLGLGCSLSLRLPPDVATAVARDRMRVVRTEHIDLYYPEGFRDEAYALAERAEGCVAALRERAIGDGGLSSRRLEIIFADLPFNNAFVKPPADGDFFTVIPTYWTFDFVTDTGLPPDPGYVACHELTHYVHAQQAFRVLGTVDRVAGYVVSPQNGLDAWFMEGLATYYEEALQKGIGRPAWPVWDAMFRAAVAERKLRGGHLSPLNRELRWGNHYVYGSRFIAYLVETYGEERLWKLVLRQGRSFFFPFRINHRFRKEYGKSLSALLDEYDRVLREKTKARARPDTQRLIRVIGASARYGRARDGSEAVISDAMDAPPTLTVYRPDGSAEHCVRLTDVLPTRKLVYPDSRLVSGVRFSSDGRYVYFVAVDQDLVFQGARLLRFDRETGELEPLVRDLQGLGGDVSPDGRSYVFVGVSGHGHTLQALDLSTLERRVLYRAPRGVYLSAPAFSPDGQRVVASIFEGAFALTVFDATTGERTTTLSWSGRPMYDATFIDAQHLLFMGEHEGRFQAYTHELGTTYARRLSDAPYLAQFPRAAQGTVRFLNREGLGYTLDEIAFEASSGDAGEVVVTGPPASLPAPATAPLGAVDDAPYSPFPRVLIPSVRTLLPFVASSASESTTPGLLGAYLGGTDAFGKHRWGASFGFQPSSLRVSGSVGYLNAQLAPLFLGAMASQLDYEETKGHDLNDDGNIQRSERQRERTRQLDAALFAAVQLRTSYLNLTFSGTNTYEPQAWQRPVERTLTGPRLFFSHHALEATAMSGPRRGYKASLAVGAYPDALGTLGRDLYDLRGELDLYAPLPLSKRHTLKLALRARDLLSAGDLPLLEVGGLLLGTLLNDPSEVASLDYPGLPAGKRFREPLRGFETLGFNTSRIFAAEARYLYPLILDVGTATSLWFMPAFFLRQIDFELFGAGATDSPRFETEGHFAVGGAVSARAALWLVPLSLSYQLSQRLTDDRALQHLLTLQLALDE